MSRPTIADLEAILQSPIDQKIEIRPNGEIHIEGGWRCTCTAYVVPGEEHRCFYLDALKLMERIAKAQEELAAKL